MNPLETEFVSHVTYGPEDPMAFQVSDDLLNAGLGNTVHVRVGDKRYRIKAIRFSESSSEIECEKDD